MRPAGLRFVIVGHLHIHILPGLGSRCHSFPFILLASTSTMHLIIKNGTKTPGGACGLIMGSNTCSVSIESPQIGGFVEGQHEMKSPAWSGKTTYCLLASPLDFYKTAKMMPYKGAS